MNAPAFLGSLVALATLAFVAQPAPLHGAVPQHELGAISVDQSGPTAWRPVTFTKTFSVPPVVILGPASFNDPEPATVRVRNVTTTGFECQIDEWDYLDGVHGSEVITFLALEPGVHDIGGRKWEAGRAADVSNLWKKVKLAGGFAQTPVLVLQIESAANPQALAPRVKTLTAKNFEFRLKTQQSLKIPLLGESVGYVAVEAGTGELDGAPFLAARTGDVVKHKWKAITFGGEYRVPVFVATIKSLDEPTPAALRYRNLTATGVEIFIEEEGSKSPPLAHTTENVGFLVIARAEGEARGKLEVGTVARAQADPATWHTVTFAESYTSPVVVLGPPTFADGKPINVRVRNVTSAGFEFQLDDWGLLNGPHALESISYLVMEEGAHSMGGMRWQAKRILGVTHMPSPQLFAQSFDAPPVVLAQVTTTNESTSVVDRLSNVTATGFTLELDEPEAADGAHAAEEVHIVAIETGKARFISNNVLFEAGATAPEVTDGFSRLAFSTNFADPIFLADLQTRNDPEPAALRQRNLAIEGTDVRVEEETSANPETTHGGEAIGYLVIAGAVDTDEDGLPDEWELAHGLNPNDPSDATADPDGDGFNNLAEYRYGTDPNLFDGGGTITVLAAVPNAYEKEGASASFRIERAGGVVPVTVSFALSGQATVPGQPGADYQTKAPGGAVISGSIEIPFNATSVEVLIEPVADTVLEYPEPATLTVLPDTHYAVGAAGAASLTIADAADTTANEQLFVAFLSAQNGAQTFASGLATLYLNGPKNRARVNLTFSGLTSNQTNAYIRYGVPLGIGPELRPTLPIGQVVNEIWNIVPVGAITGQDIVEGLFQVPGKYVYINVGTGNYPAGEISGTWSKQTGSTTFQPPGDPPPLEPLSGDELTREVARFLTQATFGPTRAEIDALVAKINTMHGGDRLAGFSAWIDEQLALDQTRLLDYTQSADAQEWELRGTTPSDYVGNNQPRFHNRRRGWWLIATHAHDQLRQRAAFALSEIFVISEKEAEVRDRHYGAAIYYDMLASAVDGRYRDLLEAVSKSPMMGKYLSHLKNQKAIIDPENGQVLISPDENYAREVMQLFSIGLVHRHPDGTLKLGGDGLPIPTYNNDDITALARVFTGWSFSKRNGGQAGGYQVLDNDNFNHGYGPRYFQALWMYPMKNFAEYHDTEAKTVLGSSIPAGLDGEADLDAALEILANHPNVAPFLSRLLIQRLVTSNPSAGYVYRVAQKFENNGAGVRGDLKAVLKAILLDYEARSLAVTANVGYGKQKEPLVRYLQLLRAFNAQSMLPLSALSSYGYPSPQLDNFAAGVTRLRYPNTDTRLAQSPLSSTTVFNFFLPDFNPGGPIAAAGLVAPELQITTETTAIQAINYHYTIAEIGNGQDVDPLVGSTNPDEDNVRIDRAPLVALYDAEIAAGKTVPEAVTTLVDHLDVLLMSGHFKARYGAAPAPNPRSIIIDGVASMTVNSNNRVRETLYLLATSPEYIHQK